MPETMKRELQRLTDHRLYELWGLTEGVATIMNPEDMRTRPQSVGRPMLGCDIRIVDPQGQDVTGTSVGEIVGRSAAMMSGYWNRPDANEDIVWNAADGTAFIRTGDIGEFDADGFMTLRGRIKDMIVSGGLNVYPIDIEMELLKHPAVMDASVAGIIDDKWGETPIAFVRLHPQARISHEALIEWANARLSKHQRLSEMHVMDRDFPRNTMGKVVKSELLEFWRKRGHLNA
jgi:acyl-CoA synthetase (AMP-forming)/AMP-acid ligase II